MNKSTTDILLEYSSLSLVLSFLIFHKLILIIAGMIIALYCKAKEDGFRLYTIEKPNKDIKDNIKKETKENNNNKQKVDSITEGYEIESLQLVEEFRNIQSINDFHHERAV